MTSHPLGRAAKADAGAKFEGLRKEGTGRLQNLEKGNYIKRHSACKATVLGNQIF